jgi:hypothetical protein
VVLSWNLREVNIVDVDPSCDAAPPDVHQLRVEWEKAANCRDGIGSMVFV